MHAKTRMKKGGVLLFTFLLMFIAMPGWHNQEETVHNGDESWRQELLKEREQKDIEFKTSATSPMAGGARLTVSAPEKTFITITDGTVSLKAQAGAGTVFAVFSREGKWYWHESAPGILCRLGERDIARNVEALIPGSLFTAGRFTLAAYPGPESLALIVFDAQRPQQLDFKHLLYFPPDARYAVPARLEKFPEKREVKITTTRKLEKTFYRYARIHFQLHGKNLALTALKSSLDGPDSDYLFIPFKDATNGKETYEVGRFMDVPEPQGEEFILDFNRCYNPLCNYSPAYNCPLPPLENFLDIGVAAGEKAYPH
ncbi:MAG: DUF1684 domain-containing protein [Chrysiogenales bacterium]|jgi:uncharacterized protein (DUF1684 family)|nr:MAG: DUF1684 domain-containing protein [Chrysiogenales bacterium]